MGKKKKEDTGDQIITSSEQKDATGAAFGAARKTVRELVSPEGLETAAPDYAIIHDAMHEYYICGLYIHKLPKRTTFATTYARLINYPDVVSNFFITPLDETAARDMADRRVRQLSVEAEDSVRDQNRHRRMMNKKAEAEAWAARIESGEEVIYGVQFLFILNAPTLDDLKRRASAFCVAASSVGIELVGCFGAAAEAFLSGYPLNAPEKINGKVSFLKTHYLDRGSMSDIFSHTNAHFMHEDGVFAGHYLDNGQVFTFDPFDRSHDNYGVVFAGSAGVGKSATIKMLQQRLIDFGMRVRTLDVDSPSTEGEYAAAAKAAGGVHFEIKPDGSNILNPYELCVETEYDRNTHKEYDTVALSDKLVYLEDLFYTIVNERPSGMDKLTEAAIGEIVSRINRELYSERGICDKKPDSLYEVRINGLKGTVRTKKKMPTFTDAYKKLLQYRHNNTNALHDAAYQILVDTLGKYVKEVYYSENTLHFYTSEEFRSFCTNSTGAAIDADGNIVREIHGIRAYFDGQSSMVPDYMTPYVDYDISQLPAADKPFAMIVCLGYMEENDIRTNSADPAKAQKMIVLIDELHNTFPYDAARRCVIRFYRQARKRFVSPWSATQSVRDYEQYPDVLAILKNSDSMFIFRHSDYDREFLLSNRGVPVTAIQAEHILRLGVDPTDVEMSEEERNKRRGEVCVIDCKRVAFIKMDYLVSTEAAFVETNIANIKEMINRTHGQEHA